MRKRLRNYRIIAGVASSLGAAVYKAVQEPLARPVSLKVLHEELGTSADMVQRFEREAMICANLLHPNIVRIFDYGRWRGEYFIVQEWVEGVSLEGLLERGRIPVNFGMYLLREITSGLAYAHGEGVIHRDIKPGNILIGFDGSVKLADFGVARSLSLPDFTIDGTLIGTPAYSAPEQIRCGKVDHRADIFSLGVVAYEIFSGANPFAADSYTEIIKKITRTRPKALSTSYPSVPVRISKAVQKMISKTPSRRLSDLHELLKILEGSRSSKTIMASAADMASYLKNPESKSKPAVVKERKKWPVWIYPVLGVGLVLIALAIVFAWPLRINKKKTETTPAQDSIASMDVALPDTLATESRPDNQGNNPVKQGLGAELSFLRFRVKPWARIYVDDKYFETTPTQKLLSVDPGRHKVKFTHDYLPAFEQIVDAGPGDTLTVSADLEADIGWLVLSVMPWGEVYIDGVRVGTTPLSAPLALESGSHHLRVIHPSFPPFESTIEAKAGDTLRKNVAFETSYE